MILIKFIVSLSDGFYWLIQLILQALPAIMPGSKKTNRLLIASISLNVLFGAVFLIGFIKYNHEILNKLFPKSQSNYNIVMLGNSLTAGGNWNALLGRDDVLNGGTGHGGFTTSHFVGMLQDEVIVHKPKICFVEGGINDLYIGVPIIRIRENVEYIIDTLKAHDIIPVLTLTIYTNRDTLENLRVDSINNIVKEMVRQKNVEYIDLNESLSENGFLLTKYTTDGLHLKPEAYPLWADKVKEVLARLKI